MPRQTAEIPDVLVLATIERGDRHCASRTRRRTVMVEQAAYTAERHRVRLCLLDELAR